MNNLPSGYFRDLQIIKEVFLPAFQELKDCLQMTTYIMNEIKVNEHILDDDKYLLIFSVEEVNRLAREGMPFRDAYKKVGLDIEAGNFSHSKEVHHTHEGSIGNLCNAEISALMQQPLKVSILWDGPKQEKALAWAINSISKVHSFLNFLEKKFGRNGKTVYLCTRSPNAEIAQLVEHNLAKVRVASSSLVFRSLFPF